MKELKIFVSRGNNFHTWSLKGEPNEKVLVKISDDEVRLRKLNSSSGSCSIITKFDIGAVYLKDIAFSKDYSDNSGLSEGSE